jgi:hypothetical protein
MTEPLAARKYAGAISALRHAILETPGITLPATRRMAEAGIPTGTLADPWLDLVRNASPRLTDGHVDELRAAGILDDEILELTLAASFGEAARRLQRGLDAVADTSDAVDSQIEER